MTRLAVAVACAWLLVAMSLALAVDSITDMHEQLTLCFVPRSTQLVLAALGALRGGWGLAPFGAFVGLLLLAVVSTIGAIAFVVGACLACMQAHAWSEIARAILHCPRGSLALEAARASFVTALPSAALALLVAKVIAELRVPGSDGLLVSAPIAGAGTTLLLTGGAVVLLRLRALRSREG